MCDELNEDREDRLEVPFWMIGERVNTEMEDEKLIFTLDNDDPKDEHLREAPILVDLDRKNQRYINLKLLLTGWEDLGIRSRWEHHQLFTVESDTVLPAHQIANSFNGTEEEGAYMSIEFKAKNGRFPDRIPREFDSGEIVKKDADGHLYVNCRAYLD